MPGTDAPLDLLARTAALVDVASPSRAEGPLVELLEAELRALAHLEVTRVGDNLVARTDPRAGRCAWCSAATPTPCPPTATPRPASTATACSASARPT